MLAISVSNCGQLLHLVLSKRFGCWALMTGITTQLLEQHCILIDGVPYGSQAVTLWEILWADDYWQRLGSWTPPSLSRPSSGSVGTLSPLHVSFEHECLPSARPASAKKPNLLSCSQEVELCCLS